LLCGPSKLCRQTSKLLCLDDIDDARSPFVIAERNQHLIQDDVIANVIPLFLKTSANVAACRQVRSMSSTTPCFPRESNAAQISTARTRAMQ
jgi:hypothetical protein